MKVITYNCKNAGHVKPEKKGKPAIITMMISGAIRLNKPLAEILSLRNGAGIEFHQDEQYPSDWYISVSASPLAFKVKMLRNGAASITSNTLVGIVAASISVNKKADTPPRQFQMGVEKYPKEKGMYALCTMKCKAGK